MEVKKKTECHIFPGPILANFYPFNSLRRTKKKTNKQTNVVQLCFLILIRKCFQTDLAPNIKDLSGPDEATDYI